MAKRILLVEDEDVLRMLIADTLEDEGYEIDEAIDGLEGFEKIQSSHYDLVIVDYMMPGMTGLELIEKTRKLGQKSDIKFLMLSAKTQVADQEKARQAGADYFMSKPFSPSELISLVEGILNEKPN